MKLFDRLFRKDKIIKAQEEHIEFLRRRVAALSFVVAHNIIALEMADNAIKSVQGEEIDRPQIH